MFSRFRGSLCPQLEIANYLASCYDYEALRLSSISVMYPSVINSCTFAGGKRTSFITATANYAHSSKVTRHIRAGDVTSHGLTPTAAPNQHPCKTDDRAIRKLSCVSCIAGSLHFCLVVIPACDHCSEHFYCMRFISFTLHCKPNLQVGSLLQVWFQFA